MGVFLLKFVASLEWSCVSYMWLCFDIVENVEYVGFVFFLSAVVYSSKSSNEILFLFLVILSDIFNYKIYINYHQMRLIFL